jgi:hypothetical protein
MLSMLRNKAKENSVNMLVALNSIQPFLTKRTSVVEENHQSTQLSLSIAVEVYSGRKQIDLRRFSINAPPNISYQFDVSDAKSRDTSVPFAVMQHSTVDKLE